MKPPKATQSAGLQAQSGPNIDLELSSIKNHLSLDMERQIQSLHHELRQELEDLVKQHDKATPQTSTLGSLIHTITDSKLHKLNLELRQHMTVTLDALLQDMKDEQSAFQARILQEMEHRLEQPDAGSRVRVNGLGAASQGVSSSTWGNLPVLLILLTLLLMLVSWPS
ncbi:MAG: hypothetical protein CMK89_05955 [Pseudomonadales bacterium]|nr:hypothetical protein [Pseudomonadales bacterium]RLU02291.1 MAG: hypothetical protein D9N11_09970 [Ketobacter sp.]